MARGRDGHRDAVSNADTQTHTVSIEMAHRQANNRTNKQAMHLGEQTPLT